MSTSHTGSTRKTNTNPHKTTAPKSDSADSSSLDQLALGFEYNKTLHQIKHEVRQRTI